VPARSDRQQNMAGGRLVVIETHPIQYRAPVYRQLQQQYGVPVTVVYGSDFSVSGYFDREFRSAFSWDTDLLSGYDHLFLARVATGGARNYESVSSRGLPDALSKLNPAVLMLPAYSPRFHQWAWLHALKTRRPILFRGETADRAQTSGAFQLGLRNRILMRLYSACSRLLYIGERSREHYRSLGCPDEKLIFSPYCVDPTPFRFSEDSRTVLRKQIRESLQISDDDVAVMFSGKLSERKGPDLLIEAVRALPASLQRRIQILFLGNGEMAEDLKAIAARTPAVKTHFAGFKNQKDLSPYFHAADLLVLPSRRAETWGLVINEALHHGVPCVVSDAVGCGPDLVRAGRTGEIFASGSCEALAAALQRASVLIGRPETRSFCRDTVSVYSVDRAARGIAEAYERVA